ncbi:hypothetical protein ACFX15_036150 [Malus domestica]
MTNDASTNWMLTEDVTLCTSWVEVTHDPILGNEMQLREMWGLIYTNYLEKIGGKRTKESLSSRWRLLSKSFSMWRDALAQASANFRSGESLADQDLQAQAWYNAKTTSKNKSFNRWECWNIVKDCPKFKVVPVGPEVVFNSTPPHSTSDHASHDHDEDDAEDVPETPPVEQASGSTRFPIRPQQGRKASKRKGNASKNDYAKYMEKLACQGELSLAWEIAKFEANKAREDAKATAIEKEFQANERERELLRQEREHVREERMAQQDRDIILYYFIN